MHFIFQTLRSHFSFVFIRPDRKNDKFYLFLYFIDSLRCKLLNLLLAENFITNLSQMIQMARYIFKLFGTDALKVLVQTIYNTLIQTKKHK